MSGSYITKNKYKYLAAKKRALDYTDIWLETKFGGDRHQRRLDKISTLEK